MSSGKTIHHEGKQLFFPTKRVNEGDNLPMRKALYFNESVRDY